MMTSTDFITMTARKLITMTTLNLITMAAMILITMIPMTVMKLLYFQDRVKCHRDDKIEDDNEQIGYKFVIIATGSDFDYMMMTSYIEEHGDYEKKSHGI